MVKNQTRFTGDEDRALREIMREAQARCEAPREDDPPRERRARAMNEFDRFTGAPSPPARADSGAAAAFPLRPLSPSRELARRPHESLRFTLELPPQVGVRLG